MSRPEVRATVSNIRDSSRDEPGHTILETPSDDPGDDLVLRDGYEPTPRREFGGPPDPDKLGDGVGIPTDI